MRSVIGDAKVPRDRAIAEIRIQVLTPSARVRFDGSEWIAGQGGRPEGYLRLLALAAAQAVTLSADGEAQRQRFADSIYRFSRGADPTTQSVAYTGGRGLQDWGPATSRKSLRESLNNAFEDISLGSILFPTVPTGKTHALPSLVRLRDVDTPVTVDLVSELGRWRAQPEAVDVRRLLAAVEAEGGAFSDECRALFPMSNPDPNERCGERPHTATTACVSDRHSVAPRVASPGEVFDGQLPDLASPAFGVFAESLGVKPCLPEVCGPDGLPPYIDREKLDPQLREAIHGSLVGDGEPVHVLVVDGQPFTGKTRAVVEALAREKRNFRLVVPADIDSLEGWVDAFSSDELEDEPVVLFADDLERYVSSSRFWGLSGREPWFDRLCTEASRSAAGYPLVVIATCGGSGRVALNTDVARHLLRDVRVVETLKDHKSARVVIADHSGFPRNLAERFPWVVPGEPFLRSLSAGPWLVERYRNGFSAKVDSELVPRGQAVVRAAMTLRKLGWVSGELGSAAIPGPVLFRWHARDVGSTGSERDRRNALQWALEADQDTGASLISGSREGFEAPSFLVSCLDTDLDLEPILADVDGLLGDLNGVDAVRIAQLRRSLEAIKLTRLVAGPGRRSTAGELVQPPPGVRSPGAPGVQESAVDGIDLSAGPVRGRLRRSATGISATFRTEDSRSWLGGFALIVEEAHDPNAPACLAQTTVLRAEGGGPVWRIEMSLPAPEDPDGWYALAGNVIMFPLAS